MNVLRQAYGYREKSADLEQRYRSDQEKAEKRLPRQVTSIRVAVWKIQD
ncbi:hypothetical protein ACT7DN_00335 [Bacillus paranthracis]